MNELNYGYSELQKILKSNNARIDRKLILVNDQIVLVE